MEDLTIEGGVAESHNAFVYGVATVHECLRSAFSGLTFIPLARGTVAALLAVDVAAYIRIRRLAASRRMTAQQRALGLLVNWHKIASALIDPMVGVNGVIA